MAESNHARKTLDQTTSPENMTSQSPNTPLKKQPLKNFTIPKIRRAAAHLEPCLTDKREYIDITSSLNKLRLDLSSDLQSSWKLCDVKLVYNNDLERKFAEKRAEMRESGRHMRELQEQFCFLVVSDSASLEIYQNGMHVGRSTMKALGNPLLGVYLYKHVDVALNHARQWLMKADTIIMFKVIFGKAKAIKPTVGNKACLDPTPNFDCHMSKNAPSPKQLIELQAIGSSVYLYEYDQYAKPVQTPRQCLPYAVVTGRFTGRKSVSVQSGTSPRCHSEFSTGKDMKNCTVAKRIGKGKDAKIIYRSVRKRTSIPSPKSLDRNSCSVPDSQNTQIPSLLSTEIRERSKSHETYNKTLQTYRAYPMSAACVSNPFYLNGNMQNRNSCSLETNLQMGILGCFTSKENSHFTSQLTTVPLSVSSTGNYSNTHIGSKLIRDPRLLRTAWNTISQITAIPFIGSLPSVNGPEFLNVAVKTNATLDTQCMFPDEPALHYEAKQGLIRENQSTSKLAQEKPPKKEEAEVPIPLSTNRDHSGDSTLKFDRVEDQQKSDILFSKVKGPCTPEVHFPEDPVSPHVSKGLFFEDIKMYESELKLKLRKHSSLLRLSEKDRKAAIESLARLSEDEKSLLFHRLKRYERYYYMYEKDLGMYNANSCLLTNMRLSDEYNLSSSKLKASPMQIKTSDSSVSHFQSASQVSTAVQEDSQDQQRKDETEFQSTEVFFDISTVPVDFSGKKSSSDDKYENRDMLRRKENSIDGIEVPVSEDALEDEEEQLKMMPDDSILQCSAVIQKAHLFLKEKMHTEKMHAYCQKDFGLSTDVEHMHNHKNIIQGMSEQSLDQQEEQDEQVFLRNLEVTTVIEISPESCCIEDNFSGHQKTFSRGNTLHEEYSLFNLLNDRIDWKRLFQNSDDLSLFTDRPNEGYTWIRRNKKEPKGRGVFPDLQIILRNEPQSYLSPREQNMLHLRKELFSCSGKPTRTSMDNKFNREETNEKHTEVSQDRDTRYQKIGH